MEANRLPLDGIRILEIAAYISGPYAGALLAALGAEVVKIEPPEGEAFRIGKGNASPYFVQYNAGKKSVAIDLKSQVGIELVKSLVARSDVLIENMRPGKLASLGLGADTCRAINPRMIYVSISGFGDGGPLRDRPAYDSIGQALGGFYTFMNDDSDVRLTGTCVADLITGVSTALGIAGALVGRERGADRPAVRIDTSILEAVSTLTIDVLTQATHLKLDPVRETRHPQAQNFCLNTASGGSIVMHLSSSQKFWQALARVAGREDLLKDPRFRTYADRVIPENYRAIRQALAEAFLKKPRAEWERLLAEADVPFAPALTVREVAGHPQMQWQQLLADHPNGHALVLPPWRFDGARPHRPAEVPQVGEHSREVLGEVRTAQELDALVANGTIFANKAAAR